MNPSSPIFIVEVEKGKWLDAVFQTVAEAQQAATAEGLDPTKAVQSYPGNLGRFPKPIPAKWLAELYRRHDMVPKAEQTSRRRSPPSLRSDEGRGSPYGDTIRYRVGRSTEAS